MAPFPTGNPDDHQCSTACPTGCSWPGIFITGTFTVSAPSLAEVFTEAVKRLTLNQSSSRKDRRARSKRGRMADRDKARRKSFKAPDDLRALRRNLPSHSPACACCSGARRTR